MTDEKKDWYDNQELYEMISDLAGTMTECNQQLSKDLTELQMAIQLLKRDLTETSTIMKHEHELTRRDMKEYNNIRGELTKVGKQVISLDARYIDHLTSPESPMGKLSSRVDYLESCTDKKVGVTMGKTESRETIIKWTGWGLGLVSTSILLYNFFTKLILN